MAICIPHEGKRYLYHTNRIMIGGKDLPKAAVRF